MPTTRLHAAAFDVAAADLNGDGVADIITGAGPGGGPHVRAFSLAGGGVTEVASFYAYDPSFTGGVTVAGGDVNGDGIAEIITGTDPSGGPRPRLHDRRDRAGSPSSPASSPTIPPSRAASAWRPRT